MRRDPTQRHHAVAREHQEKQKRFSVFKENAKFIHEFNKQGKPYKLALNKFGDLTKEEFESGYVGSRIKSSVVVIDGHEDVPENNELALLKTVANQPVSVAIEASGQPFQFYSQGVFTGNCSTELSHGVAIVGYGKDKDNTKYWIVKNSWGPDWGEQGYIRMQRDVKAKCYNSSLILNQY
ncbi:Cysteine protease [Rhynchospora pubera]|uniref:Cysteine protease n=1 Tax=Rhynchospora pubera TaxID=906938 RepID=A0AAV8H5P3_9POAL|nr:Cysteine protease [Rhynchospora pubera]